MANGNIERGGNSNAADFKAPGPSNPNGKLNLEYPSEPTQARRSMTPDEITQAIARTNEQIILKQMFPKGGASTHVPNVPRYPSGFRNFWAEESRG